MPEVAASRKQRLRTLEAIIRDGMEKFVATGFALKEIRDDELWREDGFGSWSDYLKMRVGQVFGIERSQASSLILAAQVRVKLPDLPAMSSAVDTDNGSQESRKEGWSQREVLEFARMAPKVEDRPGWPAYDVDRLSKRDVERVARKVIEYCREEERAPTSTIVRQFVDADLGIDRTAQAQETKRQRERDSHPELLRYLVDMTGRIEAETGKLATVSQEMWAMLADESPRTIKRLIGACDALADLLRRVDE